MPFSWHVGLICLGLTLIYCTWISPEEIFNSATSNDINACSIVLFVITERWPGAKKYRDAFEAVKQNVIDPLAEGKNYGPRHAIEVLKSIIPSTLPSVEMGEDRQEYSRIVTDMSGQDVDSALMQTFGSLVAVGMEQVQYQSGDILGNGPIQEFEHYRGFHEINNEQEVIDVLNQWPPSGMDFTVGFEPFDMESYSANMAEPFGQSMR
jgi:hypothetical protein